MHYDVVTLLLPVAGRVACKIGNLPLGTCSDLTGTSDSADDAKCESCVVWWMTMVAMYRMVASHTWRWLFNGAYRARLTARYGNGLLSWLQTS